MGQFRPLLSANVGRQVRLQRDHFPVHSPGLAAGFALRKLRLRVGLRLFTGPIIHGLRYTVGYAKNTTAYRACALTLGPRTTYLIRAMTHTGSRRTAKRCANSAIPRTIFSIRRFQSSQPGRGHTSLRIGPFLAIRPWANDEIFALRSRWPRTVPRALQPIFRGQAGPFQRRPESRAASDPSRRTAVALCALTDDAGIRPLGPLLATTSTRKQSSVARGRIRRTRPSCLPTRGRSRQSRKARAPTRNHPSGLDHRTLRGPP